MAGRFLDFWLKLKMQEEVPNVLLDGLYLIFEENPIEKTSFYILKPSCREKNKCFEESLRGSKVFKSL